MNKLLFILLVSCSFGIMAQTPAKNWVNAPIHLDETDRSKLGIQNNRSLQFVINDTVRMVLDSAHKTLRLNTFQSTDSLDTERLLVIDQDGNVFPQGRTTNWTETPPASAPCDKSLPWFWGGNTVTGDNNIIGTCNNHDFILKTNSVQRMLIDKLGWIKVGPNTAAAQALLDISGGGSDHLLLDGSNGAGRIIGKPDLIVTADDDLFLEYGTNKNLTISENNVARLNIAGGGNVGIGISAGSNKLTVDAAAADGIQNRTSSNTSKALSVYNTGVSASSFFVEGSGKATINIASPSGAVNALDIINQTTGMVNFRVKSDGLMYCRELNIKATTATFPDFVFNKEYKLLSLVDRENYIKENGHLPHMISAKEVEAEGGAPVGKVINGILQNTEELTLYLFEVNKKMDALMLYLNELKKENETLKIELGNSKNKKQ